MPKFQPIEIPPKKAVSLKPILNANSMPIHIQPTILYQRYDKIPPVNLTVIYIHSVVHLCMGW